jgi:tripartite-type tricarboxylate transporter receptor subunit TctC
MKLFQSLAFAAVAALASSASLSPVMAQDDYPNNTVTFLVPYAAGANGDIVSRIVADDLQKRLGQPVVIDNRPGAGGNIGAQRGKDEKPDGYTIMLGTNTHTINQNLYPDAGFDLLTDFEPVSLITTTNQLLLVNPEVPVKTVAEFIDYAKSHDLNYSSGGNGSSGHLFTELFKLKTGIQLTHIPYDGVAAGLVDLIAGRVEATYSSVSSTLEMVRTGELRALAIAAPQRSPLLPDVPTLKEAGIDGMGRAPGRAFSCRPRRRRRSSTSSTRRSPRALPPRKSRRSSTSRASTRRRRRPRNSAPSSPRTSSAGMR